MYIISLYICKENPYNLEWLLHHIEQQLQREVWDSWGLQNPFRGSERSEHFHTTVRSYFSFSLLFFHEFRVVFFRGSIYKITIDQIKKKTWESSYYLLRQMLEWFVKISFTLLSLEFFSIGKPFFIKICHLYNGPFIFKQINKYII